jgi:tRNA dimethylallyltransferase
MAKTVIVIAGPTAIGKTSLAIRLAQHYQTEIISADSRQFYREMKIGTAKPSAEELKAVKHYFINTLSVSDTFTVGDFEKQSLDLLDALFKKHDHVIVAGGSGLFINAIVRGFDELPQSSPKVRHHLNQLYSEKGIEYLQEKLKQVDPAFYLEVDIHNPQRLIRALEVYEVTGKPFSEFRNKAQKKRPFNIIEIGLNTDRKTLYDRINTRVDAMITDGLVREVEGLQPFRQLNALNTVGYAELFNYFDGNSSLEQAIEKIKQNTRRFAKRQLTWFNKSENIKWFEPHDFEQIVNYVDSLQKDPEPSEQKN